MGVNFEDEINEILNEDIVIPEGVLAKKEMAYNKIRESKKKRFSFSNKHKIAASITAVAIIGGVVFGNTAIAAIEKSLFGNNYGVQKAVDSGYVQNTDNKIMKDNGVEIKVTKVLKDSKRAALSLNLKFDDKNLVKYFKAMKLSYNIKTGDGKDIPFSEDCNYDIDKNTGELNFNDVLTVLDDGRNGDSSKNFNNIHSLNLDIRKIELYSDASAPVDMNAAPNLDNDLKKQLEEAGVKLYKIVGGTWKTKIVLDERFKDIKPIVYNALENNDPIKIVSAEMLPTGMDITFNFTNQIKPLTQETLKELDNIVLIDDKGTTYKPTERTLQVSNENNKTNVTKVFCVTAFDKVENLKMIVKDLNGNTHEIKLVKASANSSK